MKSEIRTYIVSIDPGINGGLAIFEKETKNLVLFQKNPVKEVNKKNTYNLEKFYEIFSQYKVDMCISELVHSLPGEGSVSSYHFGRSVGQIEGLCYGMKIPFTSVSPQKWKKHFDKELLSKEMLKLKEDQKESEKKIKELKKTIKNKKERTEKIKAETKIKNKFKYDYKKLAKSISRECASKLYPETEEILKKTTYDGIADAILIGVYYLSTI